MYVGYTCVQVLNGDKNNALVKEFAWDPTEPTATRPLTFRYAEKGLMLFYAFDGNKNVSDVFFLALQNGIGAHYEYAPFGAIVRTSKATSSKVDLIGANPWRFSSEFYDSELDLVYYNYRHYSPALGRWLSRDPIEEQGGLNLYAFVGNSAILKTDYLGKIVPLTIGGIIVSAGVYKCIVGALQSLMFEASVQMALCLSAARTKKCQEECCKPNYCAFIISGLVGCLFAPLPTGGKIGVEAIKKALTKFGGGIIAKYLGKLGC